MLPLNEYDQIGQLYGYDSPEFLEYMKTHDNPELSAFIDDFGSDLRTGLLNFWYNLTGQPEKTSSYQHLEEREDTSYQRAAADMAAAGLSKYFGVNPAGSSSAGASDPVAKAMAMQQLRSMKLANKEASYNLKISKSLGIRTGDTNFAAKWAEIGNVLFGFDPTKVEGGIIPWAVKQLLNLFDGSDGGDPPGKPSPSPSPSTTMTEAKYNEKPVLIGASYDQWKNINDGLKKLDTPEKIEHFVGQHIIKATEEGKGEFANYSTLPDDSQLGIFGKTLEGDIEYFVGEMLQKGTMDDYTIERLASFLADRYHGDMEDIRKKLKDKVTFVVEGP